MSIVGDWHYVRSNSLGMSPVVIERHIRPTKANGGYEGARLAGSKAHHCHFRRTSHVSSHPSLEQIIKIWDAEETAAVFALLLGYLSTRALSLECAKSRIYVKSSFMS